MELVVKTVNGFLPLTILEKSSIMASFLYFDSYLWTSKRINLTFFVDFKNVSACWVGDVLEFPKVLISKLSSNFNESITFAWLLNISLCIFGSFNSV